MNTGRGVRSIIPCFDPPPCDVAVETEIITAPADSLSELADTVRRVYIAVSRVYRADPDYGKNGLPAFDGCGGYDRFGRRRPTSAAWPRVAEHIADLGADPLAYITAQFAAATGRGRYPTPPMLTGQAATTIYQESCHAAGASLATMREADEAAVRAVIGPLLTALHWEPARALRFALNSTTIRCSPLYRVGVGDANGLTDVVSFFHGAAVTQYTFRATAYDTVWGDFVPESVRREGSRLRSTLLSVS